MSPDLVKLLPWGFFIEAPWNCNDEPLSVLAVTLHVV